MPMLGPYRYVDVDSKLLSTAFSPAMGTHDRAGQRGAARGIFSIAGEARCLSRTCHDQVGVPAAGRNMILSFLCMLGSKGIGSRFPVAYRDGYCDRPVGRRKQEMKVLISASHHQALVWTMTECVHSSFPVLYAAEIALPADVLPGRHYQQLPSPLAHLLGPVSPIVRAVRMIRRTRCRRRRTDPSQQAGRVAQAPPEVMSERFNPARDGKAMVLPQWRCSFIASFNV